MLRVLAGVERGRGAPGMLRFDALYSGRVSGRSQIQQSSEVCSSSPGRIHENPSASMTVRAMRIILRLCSCFQGAAVDETVGPISKNTCCRFENFKISVCVLTRSTTTDGASRGCALQGTRRQIPMNWAAHRRKLYLVDYKKTTVFLPLLSTVFHPDGNSRAKLMENSGK
jgi:hypothetical protein